MKKITPNYFLLALSLSLFWSLVVFSQADPKINVSYGNPPIVIVNGGIVNFGSSTEIEFMIRNVPDQGNPSLTLANPEITLSNANFVVSSRVSQFNIKKYETSVFKIRKNNFTCSSTPQSTVVTIHSNAQNFPSFSFIITFTNSPIISVLGGTPTQPVPNGQTVPTSNTGTLFGTVTAGTTSTRNYVIVNTGTCPLELQGITSLIYNPSTGVTGGVSPDFSIYIQPTPYPSAAGTAASNIIPIGGMSYFVVLFYPQSPGIKSAIISIPSNDATKSPYSFVVSGEVYNPNVTGPGGGNPDFRLWLKSNRGVNVIPANKSVYLWKDLGSTGKDATQDIAANRPTYVDAAIDIADGKIGNINFNPVVKFKNDGVSLSQFMGNTDNGYYTHETFIVMEPDVAVDGTTSPMTIISGTSANPTVADEHTGIGLGNFTSRLNGEKLWFNQWQTTTTPYYTVSDASGDYLKAGIINTRNRNITGTASTGVDLLFNTNLIGSNTASYSNLGSLDGGIYKGTPYNIGKNINSGTAYGNLSGRVAEIISYASRVLDGNRPKIESYLAIKYGITLGVNGVSYNYIDSGGTTIWNIAPENGLTFNYNITGIGMDIASDLYQKQSKSGNEPNEVTIGLGVIAATNNANINEFKKDRDFLVWGSDNGTYTAGESNTTTISNGITTSTTRINRKWKIVESKFDAGGDVENVFVSIPGNAFSGFGSFPRLADEEYALIVSDNPLFRDEDIIDIIPLKRNETAPTAAVPVPVAILNKEGSETYQTWYDFDGTKYFTFGKALKKETKQLVNSTANAIDKDFLVGEYALNLNSGSFTVGCWIRNDGLSATNRTIFGKGNNLEIRLNTENKIEAVWDGAVRFVSNTIVADGKWHNVVGVYYVGAADFYIDGVLESSTFNLKNPSPNYSRFSVGSLYIDKNNIINPFRGEIDEINIWDMALSSNQINYLMNQEIEKYGVTANGKVLPHNIANNEIKTITWKTLKAYYDFNVFYGTTVEGLTDDRNFLRIKYLNKNKQILNTQTAPLPYETIADGEWNGSNTAMWKNGGIQSIPNSILTYEKSINGIPTTFNYPINGNIVKIKNNVTSTGNKTVLGLFVEGTDATTYKTLSANNDTKVQVSHYLKLDGLIDLKGNSQLVQTLNSELDPTSIGFIKRNQQGTVNKDNYNYWSSPVGPINATTNNNNYSVDAVLKDGSTTTPQNINWVSGYNGSATTPISLARYWLYKFENGTEYANWLHFTETDQIRPSQGFTLKGPDATTVTQNYTFIGKPFNGFLNGNAVLSDNLFLVGNPYPSALDAFEFIKDNINTIDNEITGELYFWQHSPGNITHTLSGYTGGYATLTLTGGTPPVAPAGINGLGGSNKLSYQYVPVGQGFFVTGKLGIIGLQPIVFNNNQRAFIKENAIDDIQLPISNTLFKSSAKNKTVDRFNDNSNDVVYNNYNTKIRFGFTSANNLHRQLLIGFMNEKATDSIDIGYDGHQIDTQPNDSYFLINNSEFTIQGVGAFDVEKTYPIGVTADSTGIVKFMIDDTEFLPLNQKIYVHDKETSEYYDITNKTAEINLAVGTFNTRFELTFKTASSLGTDDSNLPTSMLMIYNNEIKKKLFISKNQLVNIKEISIYTITGQRIITLKEVPDLHTIEIPFSVQRGTYIVKITTDKGVISRKVLKQ